MKLNGFCLIVAASLLAAACGSSGNGSGDGTNGNGNNSGGSSGGGSGSGSSSGGGTGDDAGTAVDAAPPVDHGTPSSTYPAFKPDVPQIQNNGGPTLTAPKIVTITWPGETNAAHYEAFADGLGKTDYWKAMTSEYGIGPTVSDTTTHVHMQAAPPTTFADTDIPTIVDVNATQKANGSIVPDKTKWPAPDANTLYVLYIPQASKLTLNGQEACSSGVGGYHDNTTSGYSYAVIPQCDFGDGTPIPNEATESASHEIAEAALDPKPSPIGAAQNGTPGWVSLDDAHFGWDMFQQLQDENGDMCEFYRDSFFEQKEGAFDFFVQRQWSNAAAAAGHAPCVPATTDPYFNTTLIAPEAVTVDLTAFNQPGLTTLNSTGVHVPVGQTVSFMVGFISDAQTGPWTIQAFDGNPVTATSTSTKHFSNITVDKTTGQNGEKAQVTVTVTTAGKLKAELLTIVSSKDGKLCGSKNGNPTGICHYLPVLIGSM